jgi:hypothetical protein
VLGFLILFNAREMCSLRRRVEFGIFFIAGSTVRRTDQLNPAVSVETAFARVSQEENAGKR